jgi:pilus assembly protein CpaB
VPVAARDIAGGTVLGPADVRMVDLPTTAVPGGALPSTAAAVGRTLGGAVRRGEPLTDARVVGPGLARLAGGPGAVAVPMRLADPAVAALLRPGDHVDVVSVPQSGEATVVVAGVPVLAIPAGLGDSATGVAGRTNEGALVVVAVPAYLAPRLSSAALSTRLTVTLRPP